MCIAAVETVNGDFCNGGKSKSPPRSGSRQGHPLCPFSPADYYAGNLSDTLSVALVQKLGPATINPPEAGAAMQQIADWLEKLGMSEYAERFAESDVDTSVLRDLTDQDLKELGVSLGHRRKMLRAIAELAGAAPTSPQPALTEPKSQDPAERGQSAAILTAATPLSISAAVEATGERRYLTVMFCDLVDFDRHFSETGRRRMARFGWNLSRRGFGSGDGDGRQSR